MAHLDMIYTIKFMGNWRITRFHTVLFEKMNNLFETLSPLKFYQQ